MLAEISVQNVALIEEATLELAPGLNAITGETGAGKTLLATSLQMLLGGRTHSLGGRRLLRARADSAAFPPDAALDLGSGSGHRALGERAGGAA